ncbi:hypothetical protein [Herbaspirillum sp.]|uniref:hypothetical protein n=1 Tax=uncultured Herbaspirillum sp. TaxID=160236 RepID=UPI00257C19E0|nr:hypothetical protein [Herbaspirillum sp.]
MALEQAGQKVMASRRAAGEHGRAVLDAALYLCKQLVIDDGLVALRPDPRLFWLRYAAFPTAEDGHAGVDLIFQHEVDAGPAPPLAALQAADAVQLVRDGCGADPLETHLEHVPHHGGLARIDHQLLPLAMRHCFVSEGHVAAVVEAILGILDHAALRVLGYAATCVLVHHLQQGLHEPALIGGRVQVDRDINHVGTEGAQVALVHGGIDTVPSEARGVPGNEEVRLVLLAEGDSSLEVLTAISSAGDAAIGEGGDDVRIQVLGLLFREFQLALDGELFFRLLN